MVGSQMCAIYVPVRPLVPMTSPLVPLNVFVILKQRVEGRNPAPARHC